MLARSPFTLRAIIELGDSLRRGGDRLSAVAYRDRRFPPEQQLRMTVEALAKVRRLTRESEDLAERLASKTKRLSETERRRINDQIAENTARVVEAIGTVPFRRSSIESIANRVRDLVTRVTARNEAIASVEARTGRPARELLSLFRESERPDKGGITARRRLQTLGIGSEESASIAATLAIAPGLKRRVERQAGLPLADLVELHQALSLAASSITDDDGDEERTSPSRGQAYVEDPRVRRAIERHAMNIARAHYVELGFEVQDTSATQPFDLRCRRSDEEVRVEVKGTRGSGEIILVTTGEVLNARGPSWRTDLFIVTRMVIERDPASNELVASGGAPRIIEGWSPKECDLIPTQYRYLVPVA